MPMSLCMAGTRALFASIGASVALVAAAALSLLAISAVFAFGGWSDSVSASDTQAALVLGGSDSAERRGRVIAVPRADRGVASAPARTPRRERSAAERVADPPDAPDAAPQVARDGPGSGRLPPIPVDRPRPQAEPSGTSRPKTGDHVRKAGDTLSSTVQDAGTALANVVQPLAPPVSVAVQQVLNLVAEAVRRAADGLGNTLDTLLPPRQ